MTYPTISFRLDEMPPPEWLAAKRKEHEELIHTLEQKVQNRHDCGDVKGWIRAMRKLLIYSLDHPAVIVVGGIFHGKLVQHNIEQREILGADMMNYDGRLLFQHIPIEARAS